MSQDKGGFSGAALVLDGGSEADRRRLWEIHQKWLHANDVLDGEELRQVWSDDPHNVYFNGFGFTYNGVEDWLTLWDYLRPHLRNLKPAEADGVRVIIRGDMATIIEAWSIKHRTWVGERDPRLAVLTKPYMRATMVYIRERGDWKCVHAHFSGGEVGPRPEQAA